MTTTELKQRVLELPAEERRNLIETLWESLSAEVPAPPPHAWQRKLLDQRLEEAANHSDVWAPAEEVEEEIASALAARRRS